MPTKHKSDNAVLRRLGVSVPKRVRARLVEGETLIPAYATCAQCGRTIQPVVVWSSGLIDWEDNGDSGCSDSPVNDDYGTGGHVPKGAKS